VVRAAKIYTCARLGSDLRSCRAEVSDCEGATVVSCHLSSVMAHEAHLHGAGRGCREFPEGGHGDEGKVAPGFRPGATLPVLPLAFSSRRRWSMVAELIWRSGDAGG